MALAYAIVTSCVVVSLGGLLCGECVVVVVVATAAVLSFADRLTSRPIDRPTNQQHKNSISSSKSSKNSKNIMGIDGSSSSVSSRVDLDRASAA